MRTLLNFIIGIREAICCRPEVIVDFVFEKGLFFIAIKNIGSKPAFKVSIQFDKTITGLEGKKKISDLALFQLIEFLPPQKEIRTLLDTSTSYFGREEPTQISTEVRYEDERRYQYTHTIRHDLEIYRELSYLC